MAESFRRLDRRITVSYNAVPGPDRVEPARSQITEAVSLLLYLGRISYRKGVDLVVEAMGLLQQRGYIAELGIVGAVFPRYESVENALVERVDALGLSDRVHFKGFHTSVWSFLAATDVVIVPSRVDEPFGNTAVEAMLAARPLIASATTGLLEAAAGYHSVRMVAPNDAGRIADAVETAVRDWTVLPAGAVQDAVPLGQACPPAVPRQHCHAVGRLMREA